MEEDKNYIIRSTKESFEINVKPIWDFIRNKSKWIIYAAAGFFVLGIFIALVTPEQYDSSINLLLESPNQNNNEFFSTVMILSVYIEH